MYKQGKCINRKYIKIYVAGNGKNVLRYAISVSKSVGKAVKRNKIKRVIREIIRNLNDYLKGLDILIVAKRSIKNAGYWELKKIIEQALLHS